MRLDDGFNRVDEGLRQQRGELNARFYAVESRLDARIDGPQRTMIRIGGATIATVLRRWRPQSPAPSSGRDYGGNRSMHRVIALNSPPALSMHSLRRCASRRARCVWGGSPVPGAPVPPIC
jgi:hypothetical protein